MSGAEMPLWEALGVAVAIVGSTIAAFLAFYALCILTIERPRMGGAVLIALFVAGLTTLFYFQGA